MRKIMKFLIFVLFVGVLQAQALDLKKEISSLEVLSENTPSLEQIISEKQELIVVDFWASWCEPCKESFKFYGDILKKYKKKKILFLSVNLDDDKGAAIKFLKEQNHGFLNLWDKNKILMKTLSFEVIPHIVLLSTDWQIKDNIKGFNNSTKAKFKKWLE